MQSKRQRFFACQRVEPGDLRDAGVTGNLARQRAECADYATCLGPHVHEVEIKTRFAEAAGSHTT